MLVHPGLLCSIADSDDFAEPATRYGRWIAYDPVGNGHSDRPTPDERSYSTKRQLADVLELCEALGVERCVSAGWARGCATAARHAASQPEQVESVLMLGPPLLRERVDATPNEIALAFTELATKGEALAARAFIDVGMPDAPPEMREATARALSGSTSPEVIAAQVAGDFGAITIAEARAIPCRTLIVHGSADIIVQPDTVREMAAEVPDCTVVEIEGAGNGVWFTRPDETYAAVTEFLS